MIKHKHPLKNKLYLTYLSAVSLVGLGFVELGSPVIENVATQTPSNFIYTSMYRNREITENAIISNPKYRNHDPLRSDSLLANTVSAVKKNEYTETSSLPHDMEHGTWLWTPTLFITPEYRDEIINGAKANGIKNIYISIDSYLDIYTMEDGEEKDALQLKFDNILRDFISKAHENGITVDAEAGWKNWAELGHTYKAFAVLRYVVDFNERYEEKFRGFQYDVEPYVLRYYEDNKKPVLANFVNLIDETVARLDGTDLLFSVVVPEFYDGQYGATPQFRYAGETAYTMNHLLTILERRPGSKIIIMAYRNISRGDDGSIDISLAEVKEANKYSTKIVIAQEAGDVPPPYITFHNTSRSHLDRQLGIIKEELGGERSFGGTAIHYINAFLELE